MARRTINGITVVGVEKFDRYHNMVTGENLYVPYIQRGAQKCVFFNADQKIIVCNSLGVVKNFIKQYQNYATEKLNAINNNTEG